MHLIHFMLNIEEQTNGMRPITKIESANSFGSIKSDKIAARLRQFTFSHQSRAVCVLFYLHLNVRKFITMPAKVLNLLQNTALQIQSKQTFIVNNCNRFITLALHKRMFTLETCIQLKLNQSCFPINSSDNCVLKCTVNEYIPIISSECMCARNIVFCILTVIASCKSNIH